MTALANGLLTQSSASFKKPFDLMSDVSTKPWRIAWCHDGVRGGAKRAIYDLVRELSRRGHLIDEYIVSHQPVLDYLPLRPFVRMTHNARLVEIDGRELRPYLLDQYVRYIRRLRGEKRCEQIFQSTAASINQSQYDIVHIDHFPFCEAAGLLPYLEPPVMMYSHEVSGKRYCQRASARRFSKNGSWIRQAYTRLAQLPSAMETATRVASARHRINHARFVLTNSHFSAETYFLEHGVLPQVCRYGVDINLFKPLSLPVEPMVLSVGRLVSGKEHHQVIEAVAKIHSTQRPRVVIATPDPAISKTGADLTDLAKRLQVQLEFIRQPSQDELVRLYNQALAVVFVPLMEPFGLVAIEAMACGTPVIGVREGGVRESVLDGVTGVLVERDAQQIAAAISYFQNNPDIRKQMSQQAVEYIRQYWNWQEATNRYEEVVRRFLAQADPGASGLPFNNGVSP